MTELNDEEKLLLEQLQDCIYTKEQADAYIQLDTSYRMMLLANTREQLGLRLNSYQDGEFVELDGKYFKFEEFLLYLMSIGYIANPLMSASDDIEDAASSSKVASA